MRKALEICPIEAIQEEDKDDYHEILINKNKLYSIEIERNRDNINILLKRFKPYKRPRN